MFALHTLLADSLPRLQQHGIAVELSLDKGDNGICRHHPQLAQMIDQLLENMIDAMRHRPGPCRLRIHSRRLIDRHGARQVALEIAGNGDACHIPQPVTDDDGRAGAHDTGLSLCRYVTHEHGGHLRVATMPDGGTSVTVVLPLA